MLVLGLVVGATGLAACGDDDDDSAASAVSEASVAADSVQSQAASAVDSAQSQAESAVSDVQSQAESAASDTGSLSSQADSVASQIESAVSDATAAAGGDATAGKAVFASAGCGGCHALADAGATGAVGPNLDDVKPSQEQVAAKVAAGGGGMPAFAGQLSPEEILNVAAYVSSVAGK
jgi:mono/diheme cytochrome c family protein